MARMTGDEAVRWVTRNRKLIELRLRRKGRDLAELQDHLQDAHVAALLAVRDQDKPNWCFESFFWRNFASILTKTSSDPMIVERRRMMAGATPEKRNWIREQERRRRQGEETEEPVPVLVQLLDEEVSFCANPWRPPFLTRAEFLEDPPLDLDRTARKIEPLLLPAQRPVFRKLLGLDADGCHSLAEAARKLDMRKGEAQMRFVYAMKRVRSLVEKGKLDVANLPRLRLVCLSSPGYPRNSGPSDDTTPCAEGWRKPLTASEWESHPCAIAAGGRTSHP